MPPSAAAESSKEVKLRKTCGRPILWCGGGTRIHNFFRLAIFFVWQYLWGRGEHDPSRHLSPDRRTRMGRDKISTTLLNTLMCGEIGRISRVGSFVDKNDVKFWLVSSFASAAAKLHYELSLEIQKYRLQCGRIYEIMEKFWVDVAYGVWSAAAFLGICVLKLWRAALSLLWMRTHCRRVFICPAAGGGYRYLYHLSRPPEAKNRHFSSCSKSSKFDKNSL